jgi:ABC-type uncharacterized transport system substrate-binding protein
MSWDRISRLNIVSFKVGLNGSPALLTELVAFGPELIVTSTSDSAAAIHSAAPTIPMVFLTVADPVGLGLVKSLAHPGGNVTGFATTNPEGFVAKHLQFLQAAVPGVKKIAVLINPTIAMHQPGLQKLPLARQLLGAELVVVEASKPEQIRDSFRDGTKAGRRSDRRLEWSNDIH